MDFLYENRVHLLREDAPASIYRNVNFEFRAHWHPEIELIRVESGSICVGANAEQRILQAGDMAVFSPGEIHYYERRDPESVVIILVFKPEAIFTDPGWTELMHFQSPFFRAEEVDVERVFPLMSPIDATLDDVHVDAIYTDAFFKGEAHLDIHHQDTPVRGLNEIPRLLHRILEEKQGKAPYPDLFMQADILTLCGLLLRHHPRRWMSATGMHTRMNRMKKLQTIIGYVEAHYREELTLESLAARFDWDVSHLCTTFRSVTGTGFPDFLHALRVQKAETLIRNTQAPLTEIALECGFNSIRTFNRVFRQVKGVVPSALRRG